jgi:hypothetical protein
VPTSWSSVDAAVPAPPPNALSTLRNAKVVDLAQAEVAEDEQNNDYGADQPNDTVHDENLLQHQESRKCPIDLM